MISLLCSLITVVDVPGMEKGPQADTVKKFDHADCSQDHHKMRHFKISNIN